MDFKYIFNGKLKSDIEILKVNYVSINDKFKSFEECNNLNKDTIIEEITSQTLKYDQILQAYERRMQRIESELMNKNKDLSDIISVNNELIRQNSMLINKINEYIDINQGNLQPDIIKDTEISVDGFVEVSENENLEISKDDSKHLIDESVTVSNSENSETVSDKPVQIDAEKAIITKDNFDDFLVSIVDVERILFLLEKVIEIKDYKKIEDFEDYLDDIKKFKKELNKFINKIDKDEPLDDNIHGVFNIIHKHLIKSILQPLFRGEKDTFELKLIEIIERYLSDNHIYSKEQVKVSDIISEQQKLDFDLTNINDISKSNNEITDIDLFPYIIDFIHKGEKKSITKNGVIYVNKID